MLSQKKKKNSKGFEIDILRRDNKGYQEVCKLVFTVVNLLYGLFGGLPRKSSFPSHLFGPRSSCFIANSAVQVFGGCICFWPPVLDKASLYIPLAVRITDNHVHDQELSGINPSLSREIVS
jgi:hypothetical protein